MFDNFGEFRSLIFLRIFEFDIFRNIWFRYFWKYLSLIFLRMQSGSKSETGGGDSLLPRLEALNLELLPTSDIKTYGSLPKVKPSPSRQTCLELEILSNWYFYGRASCSNDMWKYSKDLPCSAVFLVTESESGKWIDFMIACCHCAFYGTKNVNGSVNVLVLIFSCPDQSDLVEYFFFCISVFVFWFVFIFLLLRSIWLVGSMNRIACMSGL